MAHTDTIYEGTDNFIFISYSHLDREIVVPIIDELRAAGFRVWFDKGVEITTEFSDVIGKRIRECALFMAFISQNFAESEFCLDEIAMAKELKKTSCVIYIQDENELHLPDGLLLKIGRFQKMFLCRYDSHEEFIDELCAGKALQCCRIKTAEITPAAPEIETPDPEPEPEEEPSPFFLRSFLINIGTAAGFTVLFGELLFRFLYEKQLVELFSTGESTVFIHTLHYICLFLMGCAGGYFISRAVSKLADRCEKEWYPYLIAAVFTVLVSLAYPIALGVLVLAGMLAILYFCLKGLFLILRETFFPEP